MKINNQRIHHHFRKVAIVIGLAVMVITIVSDVKTSFFLIPFHSLFLFLYVRKVTQQPSLLFLVYLIATMTCEVLFLIDFEKYFLLSLLSFATGCIALLLLMRPVIKKGSDFFSSHYVVELIVGFIGFGFILGDLVYIILPMVPDVYLFLFSAFIFSITLGICFLIPAFNKSTENFPLFIISGAYAVQIISVFINEYIYESLGLLLVSILTAIIVKVTLATYLTKIDTIYDQDF